MALPLKWQDRFVRLGYPSLLRHASWMLLAQIGLYINGITLRTNVRPQRLRAETGMARTTFFDAKSELIKHGLLTWTKIDGQRWFSLPVLPPAPSQSPIHGMKKSDQLDVSVSPIGPVDGETPTQTQRTAHSRQQIKTQLGKQISSLLPALGLDEDILPMLLGQKQVEELCRSDVTLDDIAYNLSRAVQSCGHPVHEKKVRAALDQDVQMASRVFGARIVEI